MKDITRLCRVEQKEKKVCEEKRDVRVNSQIKELTIDP